MNTRKQTVCHTWLHLCWQLGIIWDSRRMEEVFKALGFISRRKQPNKACGGTVVHVTTLKELISMIIPEMGNSPGNSGGFLQAIVATRWGELEILKECCSNFLFIWITLVLQEEKGRRKYITAYNAFKSTVLTFAFITVILINAASQKLERKLLPMSTKAKAANSVWRSCRFSMQIRPQWAAPWSFQHTRTIIRQKESGGKGIWDVGSSSSVQQSSCCLQTSHISRKWGRIPFSINIYLLWMKWEWKWALQSPALNVWYVIWKRVQMSRIRSELLRQPLLPAAL